MSGRLGRSFFARPAVDVAPDLLGRTLVRTLDAGQRLAARIVETEAYEPGDPASHGFRGMTRRNAVMFGRPGHLYVYFVYGMHWCANVVTGAEGAGSAVLLRAGEPLEGAEIMAALRHGRVPLLSGPARLAQGLGLDGRDSGVDLCRPGRCWIESGTPVAVPNVMSGPRVGLRVATEVPWRFWDAASGSVSGPQVTPRPAPRRS